MTRFPKALMLIAALGVAACTSGNRFDSTAGGAGAGAGAGTGAAGGIVPGSANDPASPAYFNQTVGDRVLFAVDQSTLSPEAQATLNGQAQWLQRNSDYLAVIEGHADEQGTREYNLALGARRANAVMEYLVSQGISSDRLRYVSYGKERPVEVCSVESCYAKNRRAVTVISMGVSS
ncbi:peptidoglycan-associated lipoprotein Pal [Salipiger mucosus]|uniref:Peptidoglycan-associated lipoprotein n=1 Tax=Salipiger mucosus DSM 16094 TaxID=1123237 RepID=S9R4I1_9RHOB|nr:peptidoglycan-associated lipoprotein Pal [Salipiger mucosus]EPX86832.1 18K peptidoglycan-associated outer membrane lipoprotein [Salipiger mucosus DSM 16094]